jgi:hypothetical protein
MWLYMCFSCVWWTWRCAFGGWAATELCGQKTIQCHYEALKAAGVDVSYREVGAHCLQLKLVV